MSAANECPTCGGTGLIDPGTDPETGIYGGEDCRDCGGTGDAREWPGADLDFDRTYRLENAS